MKFSKKWGVFVKGEGGVGEMLKIAYPLVISYACDTIMLFTDRLFLSKLGTIHMSAAMGGGMTSYFFSTFFVGLISYSNAMVAQRFGAKQHSRCGQILFQAILVALVAWPLLIGTIPLGDFIFKIFKLDSTLYSLQIEYFQILMLGLGFPLLRNSFSNFYSGIGRTRLIMLASFITMLTNVGLNYVLIFGKFGLPALGIKGAAIGTIIAGAIGVLVLLGLCFKKNIRLNYFAEIKFRMNWPLMKELWRLGSPAGLELFLNLAAFTALVLSFHGVSPIEASAITIAFNWDMVSFIPLLGINVGVSSLVGRYVGRKKLKKAYRATYSAMGLAFIYSTVLIVIYFSIPQVLVDIFQPSGEDDLWHEVRPLAIYMVQLISIYLFADALTIVFSGALRGAGDTFWTMILSVGVHFVLAFEAYLLLHIFKIGAHNTWLVLVFSFFLLTLVYVARYKFGNWQQKALSLTSEDQKKIF